MRIEDFYASIQQKNQTEELMSALRRVTLVKDVKRLAGDETTSGWIPWDHGYDQRNYGH